tara:strand:+ start:125 stop:448 length:324 start_codon:yes stop_codon:yes gene_type:complete
MSDSIFCTDKDAGGNYRRKEKAIAPTTQAEADAIYDDLSNYLAPELIYSDGEASMREAQDHINFYMAKAIQVERLGFLPSNDSDAWQGGTRPSTQGYYKLSSNGSRQ